LLGGSTIHGGVPISITAELTLISYGLATPPVFIDAAASAPHAMNAEVTALGPSLNVFDVEGNLVPAAPAFVPFEPTRFLRPHTDRSYGN